MPYNKTYIILPYAIANLLTIVIPNILNNVSINAIYNTLSPRLLITLHTLSYSAIAIYYLMYYLTEVII
jgi:hypothetical protein